MRGEAVQIINRKGTKDYYSSDQKLTAHLSSLILSEQDSAATSNPTLEDNVKKSTNLASKC